jgi:hypothetical protein
VLWQFYGNVMGNSAKLWLQLASLDHEPTYRRLHPWYGNLAFSGIPQQKHPNLEFVVCFSHSWTQTSFVVWKFSESLKWWGLDFVSKHHMLPRFKIWYEIWCPISGSSSGIIWTQHGHSHIYYYPCVSWWLLGFIFHHHRYVQLSIALPCRWITWPMYR